MSETTTAGTADRDRDAVVSSDSELLILVDEHDREIGFLDKASAHDGAGQLHRAFSIFLLDERGRVLLQQRAAGKRLWPLYWSNTCCSHPRRGEAIETAADRRLAQELGLSAELEFVYKFTYDARFGDVGSEREVCSVFVGRAHGATPTPNRNEVAAWRWVAPAELERELAAAPQRFTPWFRLEWRRLTRDFGTRVGSG